MKINSLSIVLPLPACHVFTYICVCLPGFLAKVPASWRSCVAAKLVRHNSGNVLQLGTRMDYRKILLKLKEDQKHTFLLGASCAMQVKHLLGPEVLTLSMEA